MPNHFALKTFLFGLTSIFKSSTQLLSSVLAQDLPIFENAVSDPVAAGTDFLAHVRDPTKFKGTKVTTLPSGLSYRILQPGSGQFHPKPNTPCKCHYSGKLVNGDQFDSSYDRGEPTTFAPNQVIKGWTEAMQLMVEGDKWEMYIPSDLAYGEHGSPPKIPGKSVLVFTMEIVSIDIDSDHSNVVPAIGRCNVEGTEYKDCDDREKKYVEKMKKGKSISDISKEMERLEKVMSGNNAKNMKKEQYAWVQIRVILLGKLKGVMEKEEL